MITTYRVLHFADHFTGMRLPFGAVVSRDQIHVFLVSPKLPGADLIGARGLACLRLGIEDLERVGGVHDPSNISNQLGGNFVSGPEWVVPTCDDPIEWVRQRVLEFYVVDGNDFDAKDEPVELPPLLAAMSPEERQVAESRRLPPWDECILSAAAEKADVGMYQGAWSTFLTGELLGMSALASVLRYLPEPSTRRLVEIAVPLVLVPTRMTPLLPRSLQYSWESLCDTDRAPGNVKSVKELHLDWERIIHKATIQQVLARTEDGLWMVGPDIGDVQRLALDARAIVVLAYQRHTDQRLAETRAGR